MAMVTTTSVDWTARTCAQLIAWRNDPTMTELNTLVADSTHLGRSYLRADVAQLDADRSSPSPSAAKYLTDDWTYAYEDCANGSGS